MAFSYCPNCRKYMNAGRCESCGTFDLQNDEQVYDPDKVEVEILGHKCKPAKLTKEMEKKMMNYDPDKVYDKSKYYLSKMSEILETLHSDEDLNQHEKIMTDIDMTSFLVQLLHKTNHEVFGLQHPVTEYFVNSIKEALEVCDDKTDQR